MSALLCCGSCFDAHNLSEEGIIYSWLDSLLTSSDDKVSMIYSQISKKLQTPFDKFIPEKYLKLRANLSNLASQNWAPEAARVAKVYFRLAPNSTEIFSDKSSESMLDSKS